jgi:hypothetical protein
MAVSSIKKPTVPGLPFQANLIQAINEGDIDKFTKALRDKEILTQPNDLNYTPYRYLELLTKRAYNPKRAAHKRMLTIANTYINDTTNTLATETLS